MSGRIVLITLSRLEAQHLADVVAQFSALLSERTAAPDPVLDRLTPDAYPDDAEAAAEFRSATAQYLLDRREEEALGMLADLAPAFGEGSGADPVDDLIDIPLDEQAGWAWMRTLAAVRLVIAGRLGITSDDEPRDESDDRFGVYDWLGYRLDGIVNALGVAQ